jgi:hypothetical protein
MVWGLCLVRRHIRAAAVGWTPASAGVTNLRIGGDYSHFSPRAYFVRSSNDFCRMFYPGLRLAFVLVALGGKRLEH